MTKFYLMMIIPNPWLDLDGEPSNSSEAKGKPQMPAGSETGDGLARPRSDGGVEACAWAEAPEAANTEPSRVHLADVASGPSEPAGEGCLEHAPAGPFDCIAEIFIGHAKSNRRFALNVGAFELALIDPPPPLPFKNVA